MIEPLPKTEVLGGYYLLRQQKTAHLLALS